MNELPAIENWLHDKLVADAEVFSVVADNVYKYALPQKARYPCVVYSLASGFDFQGLGTVRILTRPLYLVKVISRGVPTSLVNLCADRVDELIGKAVRETFVSTAGDQFAISARRETPVQFMERDTALEGSFYFHLGGLYRMEVFGLNRKVVELNDAVSLSDAVSIV
jgi:hypothetical protein